MRNIIIVCLLFFLNALLVTAVWKMEKNLKWEKFSPDKKVKKHGVYVWLKIQYSLFHGRDINKCGYLEENI